MMNKKGVSAVVATVLIILITIAAVTIIWSAIIPLIQNNIAGTGDCLIVSGQISINEGSSCINKGNNESEGNITIGVHRGPGNFELTAIVAKIITSEGNSYSYTITNVSQLTINGDRAFTLNNSSFGIGLTEFNKTVKINVAPKVKIGAQSKECDPVREALIANCA